MVAVVGWRRLPEPIEGALPVLVAQPWTLVGDVELDPVARPGRRHRDAASARRRIERVGEQVVQHLVESTGGHPGGQRAGKGDIEPVQATSLAVRRLPRRAWRAVHRLAVVVFGLVTVHALAAGSEAGNPAARWFALGSLGLVTFRLLGRRRAKPRVRHASVPERV